MEGAARERQESSRVLACVHVALRESGDLFACKELLLAIQDFIDGPRRWRRFKIPVTETLTLCRRSSRDERAAKAVMTAAGAPTSEDAPSLSPRAIHMVSSDVRDVNRALLLAAAKGYLHIVQWLHANHVAAEVSRRVMDIAAAFGHLEIAKWLHVHRSEGCTEAAMTCACESGRIDIAKWLLENRTEGCAKWTLRWILHTGDLEVAKWLNGHQLGGDCVTSDMDDAAEKGRFDIVKFLHRNRKEGCTSNAMDKAAERGHFDIVKFLHKHRSEGCTTHAMDMAAANGHLDIVVYLHENRSEGCTTQAMDLAARAGHMRVIRWLQAFRREGCTIEAMNGAAKRNDLETMKFLHRVRSEGCTEVALQGAVMAENLEMLDWLYENYPSIFSPAAVKRGISISNNRRFIETAIWLLDLETRMNEW